MRAGPDTGVPAGRETVDTAMTRCPIAVPVDATCRAVGELLSGRRISAVPVLDAGDRPVGVVSEVDLMRAAAGGADLAGLTAGEVMSTPVRTVPADESLSSVRCGS